MIDPGSAPPRILVPPALSRFLRPSRQGNPGRSSGAIAITQSPVGFTDDQFPSRSTIETVAVATPVTAAAPVPATEAVPGSAGIWCTPGRAGSAVAPDRPTGTAARRAQLPTGQPPRYTVPVHLSKPRRRPSAHHRRGRSPSKNHRATTPMVRRWDAGCNPASRKAGAPGPHRARRRNGDRIMLPRENEALSCENRAPNPVETAAYVALRASRNSSTRSSDSLAQGDMQRG